MKISGCIITRNEEENIEKCVKNLKRVADEIIVVDTGSEDDTVRRRKTKRNSMRSRLNLHWSYWRNTVASKSKKNRYFKKYIN